MFDPAETRPGLNLGRYLFYNRVWRAVVSAADAWGHLRYGTPKRETSIQPSKILVSLQAHIGDVIIGTSALPVLKAAFPNADIGFLTHPGSRIVLQGHPLVERVHTFEHWNLNRQKISRLQKLIQHFTARRRLVAELKAERYDLAIDLYAYTPNSIPILASAGIPTRVGWTSGGFGPWLTHALDWSEDRNHVLEWHKRLLGTIEACRPHLDKASPTLEADPQALAEWAQMCTRRHIGVTYVVFHVGIGTVQRRWIDAEWRALVEKCAALNLKVLLMGQGALDESLSRVLAQGLPHAIDLVGKLSWPVMSVALAGAKAVVGLDSMSSHVAAAWQVPTLCITTGQTDPIWRPYGANTRIALTPTPCAPCYVPNGCDGMECIRRTDSQTVFTILSDMLREDQSIRQTFEPAA